MKTQKKYANIVFVRDSEADEPLEILNNLGVGAAVEYLAQWDFNEYWDISDGPGMGTSDRSAEHNGYLLTYNTRLGYIGLEKIIDQGHAEQ